MNGQRNEVRSGRGISRSYPLPELAAHRHWFGITFGSGTSQIPQRNSSGIHHRITQATSAIPLRELIQSSASDVCSAPPAFSAEFHQQTLHSEIPRRPSTRNPPKAYRQSIFRCFYPTEGLEKPRANDSKTRSDTHTVGGADSAYLQPSQRFDRWPRDPEFHRSGKVRRLRSDNGAGGLRTL